MPIPIIAGVAALCIVAAILAWFLLPVLTDRATSQPAAAIPARDLIDRCNTDTPKLANSGMWVPNYPHDEPDRPLSIDEAHKAMRGIHLECSVEHCLRKRAAMQTLYRAGKLTPSRRVEQWVTQ